MYHFIYPSKDTYIYELNTNSDKNFGGDTNLVLKKDFDGLNGLNGVSRILLHFDLTEVSNSIVSGEITGSQDADPSLTSPKYYLRLYDRKSSELSGTYSLATFPLSSSWEEGTGTFDENPNKRDGVSWEKGDENISTTSWSFQNTGSSDSNRYELLGGTVTASMGSTQISGSGTLFKTKLDAEF